MPDDVWEMYCRLPDGYFMREDVCIDQRDFIDMILNGLIIREPMDKSKTSAVVEYMKV